MPKVLRDYLRRLGEHCSFSLALDSMENSLKSQLTEEECENLRETCATLEQKITNKRLQDYQNYEKFLVDFLHKLQKISRDQPMQLEEWTDLESYIQTRINYIINEMLKNCGYDYDICVKYYHQFYRDENRNRTQTCVDTLMERHSTHEETWLLAAQFYKERLNDYNKGKLYLRAGIKHCLHPKSLYKAMIRNELDRILKSSCHEEIKVIRAARVQEKYVEDTFERDIKDFDFYMNIFEILNEYVFTGEVIDYLNGKMLEEYPQEPKRIYWVAKRELDKAKAKGELTADIIEECLFEAYKDGYIMMSTNDKKLELIDIYLDHAIKYKQREPYGSQIIDDFMDMAYIESVLVERHYVYWLRLSGPSDDHVWTVFKKGLTKYPESARLWQAYVHSEVRRKAMDERTRTVFEEGLLNFNETPLALWDSLLSYVTIKEYISRSESIKTIEIFKLGMAQEDPIAQAFKDKYLKWAIIYKKIPEVREIYDDISIKPPYLKQLHIAMSYYESSICQLRGKPGFHESDLERFEKVYVRACQQFENDADVWLNYIVFLKIHKPYFISAVFDRASEILQESELIHFKQGAEWIRTVSSVRLLPILCENFWKIRSSPI